MSNRVALLALVTGVALGSGGPAAAQSAPADKAPTVKVDAAVAPAQQGWMVGPALYVSDHTRSLRFYIDGLGMKVRLRFGPPDKPDMVVGFGNDPMQPGIMLLTDKEGPTPRPIGHVHGFDRIAWRLPNIAGVRARLIAAGYTPGEITIAHGVIQVMMVTDPDGYRLELIDTNPAPKAP